MKARRIADNLISGVLGGALFVMVALFVVVVGGWFGADVRVPAAEMIGWMFAAAMAAGGLLGVMR
jgi:hypothetical protein